VLVTELAPGSSFAHFRDTASQGARNAAGLLLFEFAFRAIFERCVFNGDPHPGNYLFHDDGSVVFLDFGCVRVFDAAFIDNWKGIARAMLREDKAEFARTYAAGGFVGGRGYDLDAQYEVIRYLYEPMLAKSFQYNHDYVKRSWKVLVMNSNFRKTALPPEWLLIQRLQWGLNSLLADLGAEGDFRSIFARYVDGPTRPVQRPNAMGYGSR
jgi:predicted unusual protein kinase regulating ubiquinone biosynthesis (AarF/ABC1/UbiB family)